MKFPVRLWLMGLLGLSVASFLYSTYLSHTQQPSSQSNIRATNGAISPIGWIILTPIQGWRESIAHLMKQGVLQPEDLETLDFSQHGEVGYGDNLQWEVFNPTGRFKLGTAYGDAFDPAILNQAVSKPVRILFNLRRSIDNTGKAEDRLYLIIPDISERQCVQYYNPFSIQSIEAIRDLPEGLEIASDNHTLIIDGSSTIPGNGGCIQTPDRRIYLFLPFYTRLQK